jgi:hypothetical protein
MAIRDLIEHSPRRRKLLRAIAAGTAGAALPGAAGDLAAALSGRMKPGQVQMSAVSPPLRVTRNGMGFRRLGRTKLMISEISLGGSPLPDEGLLRRLVDRGINYIDTSDSYENGNCERKVGRLFQAIGRDKLFIHARFHLQGPWTERSIVASVEGSLRRLGTDTVDVLGIHGVENPEDVTDERVLAAFEKLKGKFRFRGLTCHVNAHAVIPKAVECGLYDMVQVGYNVFDLQETEKEVKTYGDYLGESGIRKLIDLCRSKDVGVTAMKVLKVGGRRQDLASYRTEGTSLFQAMLKWALENESLASVVTEILNDSQMDEDLGALDKPLTGSARRMLHAHVAANAGDYCHFCGLCRTACPAGVPTAAASRGLVYAESYDKPDRAREELAGIRASLLACSDCGACERVCPYGLAVRERTRRADHTIPQAG